MESEAKRKLVGNNILTMYDFNPYVRKNIEKNVDNVIGLNEIATLDCCNRDYERKGIEHPCMDGMLYI